MSVHLAGWLQREDDPIGVKRWWDGERWTARITGGEAAHALAASEREVAGQHFPDVNTVREVEVLRQRVQEIANVGIESSTAPPVVEAATHPFPTPRSNQRSTGDKIVGGINMVARVFVSLVWAGGVVLCFAVGAPIPALVGLAYLAYLWVWRGRWLIY